MPAQGRDIPTWLAVALATPMILVLLALVWAVEGRGGAVACGVGFVLMAAMGDWS